MSKPILVVGSLNMDLVVRVPRHPRPGETLLGGAFHTFPGGKGKVSMWAAAGYEFSLQKQPAKLQLKFSGVTAKNAKGNNIFWLGLALTDSAGRQAPQLLWLKTAGNRLEKTVNLPPEKKFDRLLLIVCNQGPMRYRDGDARLGGRRAETTQAVMAALEEKLDAARRLRLVRDRWALTRDALMAYRDRGRDLLGSLEASRRALEDIRRLAGPPPGRLDALERRTRAAQQQLAVIAAPHDAAGVHALVVSAAQLSLQAAMLRRRAIASADLDLARDASAAAAGALMLAERARVELDRLTRPPELQ